MTKNGDIRKRTWCSVLNLCALDVVNKNKTKTILKVLLAFKMHITHRLARNEIDVDVPFKGNNSVWQSPPVSQQVSLGVVSRLLISLTHDVPTQTFTSGHLFRNKISYDWSALVSRNRTAGKFIQWSTLGFRLGIKCNSKNAASSPVAKICKYLDAKRSKCYHHILFCH